MIISTYNPKDAKATCPKCGFVDCEIKIMNLASIRKYIVFYHEACDTTWEVGC